MRTVDIAPNTVTQGAEHNSVSYVRLNQSGPPTPVRDGCEFSPTCVSCPLPVCKDEMGGHAMAELWLIGRNADLLTRRGWSVNEVSEALTVSGTRIRAGLQLFYEHSSPAGARVPIKALGLPASIPKVFNVWHKACGRRDCGGDLIDGWDGLKCVQCARKPGQEHMGDAA